MQYWAPLHGHHLLLLKEMACLFEILCYSWVFAGEIKSSGWTFSKTMKGVHHPGVQAPWRRHLEPCALQDISEVNALSCLILLGLCYPHNFPSSDMT